MANSKGIYVAAAPLALLLIAGVSARYAPQWLGNHEAGDNDEVSAAATPVFSKKGVAPTPQATPLPVVDRKTQAALEKAVAAQIGAIHGQDFAKAFKYVSPVSRSITTSPDAYRTFIQFHYPALLNAETQIFQPATGTSRQAAMAVLVAAQDGSVTKYVYILSCVNGTWLVDGCGQVAAPPPLS